MNYWLKLSALLLVAAALLVAFLWHYNEAERKYGSIRDGMTIAEVEEIMGKPPWGVQDWLNFPQKQREWHFSFFGKERAIVVIFYHEQAIDKLLWDERKWVKLTQELWPTKEWEENHPP